METCMHLDRGWNKGTNMRSRKNIIVIAAALLTAVVLANIPVLAETVTGMVFLDANSNGAKDTGEAGVGGMMISDGDDVIKTSSSGSYNLTFNVTDTRFVFITTPTGYRLTTPFYLKIEPGGSTYAMDFGLTPDPTPSNVAGADFKFIAGGDIQYDLSANETELRYDWQTMEDLARSIDIGFATWAGDLTPDGKLVNLQLLCEVENTLSYPTYNCLGNHDDGINGVQNWEEAMGPYYYSWDYAGRHFIILDSEVADTNHHGIDIIERQRRWVLNDLAQIAPGTDVYLEMHRPEATHIDMLLDEIASNYNVRGIIRGHIHTTYSYRSRIHNIPIMESSPIRRYEFGVFTKLPRIVTISGSEFSSQIFPLGQEKRLIVVSPTPDSYIQRSSSVLILANAFNSSSKVTSVKYTLTGPSGTMASNVSLTKSTWWSWRGTWDASNAPEGAYTLEVVVSDDQTQSWQKTTKFSLSNDQPTAFAPGQNWPCFFGPDNKNRLTADSPSGLLQILWAAPVGTTERGAVLYSSPVVVDGKVFVGVWDPDLDWPEGGVAAFDAMTGQRLWKLNIGAVYHTPAVYNGRLYALTSHGVLNCIDIDSEIVLWTFDIYASESYNYDHQHAISPVTVSDGKVYVVGNLSDAYCLNAEDGTKIWGEYVQAQWHTLSGIYVEDGVAYFVSQYNIYARNADTGALLYSKSLGYRNRRSATPLVYDNVMYSVQTGNLVAYDVTDNCSEIWRIEEGGWYKFVMPVYRNGKIYYSKEAELIVKAASDGSDVWRFSTDDAELMAGNKYQLAWDSSSHALTDKYDYVGSDNGAFYVLDADTGKQVWRYFFGPPVKSSAAISGNMVFIGCTDGNLYAFGPGLVPGPKIKDITPAVVIEWEGMSGPDYNIYWRDNPEYEWALANTVNGCDGINRWIDCGGDDRPKPRIKNEINREYKVELTQ
jgi:outer membrane protein assembly factor BamB